MTSADRTRLGTSRWICCKVDRVVAEHGIPAPDKDGSAHVQEPDSLDHSRSIRCDLEPGERSGLAEVLDPRPQVRRETYGHRCVAMPKYRGFRESALSDPVGFVRRLDRVTIDEVQRAPDVLQAIKFSVDEDRRPGRFLLTGSANVLDLPQVSESLAGRRGPASVWSRAYLKTLLRRDVGDIAE